MMAGRVCWLSYADRRYLRNEIEFTFNSLFID